MVETTRQTTRVRHSAPATTALSRTSGAPFWALAFLLVLGIGIAIVLALRGVQGPGLFTTQQAFTATGMALFIVALVLVVFLGTIAFVFGEVRRLRTVGEERERSRLADVNRQETVNRTLRDEVAALRQREHLLLAELSKRRKLATGVREREGEMHVLQLEGIGPRFATRLNSAGIITVGQLESADAEDVARRVESTPEQVREWQAMARLVQVKGVGPQWAEALARIGVHDAHDLASRDPKALAEAIARLNDGKVRVTGSDPSSATVSRWVRAAGGNPPRASRKARPGRTGMRPTRRTTVRPTRAK